MAQKSKCHGANVRVASGDEGTNYYVCGECGEACDLSFEAFPRKAVGYPEQQGSGETTVSHETLTPEGSYYEPTPGEPTRIVMWCRWPSYDFIFAIPLPESPRAEKEKCLLQIRHTDARTVPMGAYLDETELKDMIRGLISVAKFQGIDVSDVL
jgi:hypothetical protein